MYGYRFDFDGGIRNQDGVFIADPPHVYITFDGSDLMEVFCNPVALLKCPDTKDEHWSVPAFVTALVALMNDSGDALMHVERVA